MILLIEALRAVHLGHLEIRAEEDCLDRLLAADSLAKFSGVAHSFLIDLVLHDDEGLPLAHPPRLLIGLCQHVAQPAEEFDELLIIEVPGHVSKDDAVVLFVNVEVLHGALVH